MDIKETPKTLQEEMRALEEGLRKKREAGESSREEKEIFRDVLREHIEQARETVEHINADEGEESLPHSASPHDYAAEQVVPADRERGGDEHKDQVNELVAIALSEGIMPALRVARRMGSLHLLDDFHDALVDDYYEKILHARKIASP